VINGTPQPAIETFGREACERWLKHGIRPETVATR
jgi:hypothetical protein